MLIRYGDEDRELTDLLIEDGVVFLVVLLLCFVVDFLMKTLGWFTDDKNGRYFSIHFLINIYVVIVQYIFFSFHFSFLSLSIILLINPFFSFFFFLSVSEVWMM